MKLGARGKPSLVPRKYFVALLAGVVAQSVFWVQAHRVRIAWSGVDQAPSESLVDIMSLGDDQLFYRAAALGLQNAGDWAGELTPLIDYDYARLAAWFTLLSRVDPQSQYAPTLAGYYFGQSRNPEQVRQIVEYLRRLAMDNPGRQWRWLAYSVYLARHRIKDQPLALELAYQLAALPIADMPIWTRQLPAFVLADTGEKEAARDILEAILEGTPALQKSERNFMRNYIDSKLGLSSGSR